MLNVGDRPVKVVTVSEGETIGRASNDRTPDIVVPAEFQSVSKWHARLSLTDGRAVLTDFSKYGTIVNDRVILGESVALGEDDLVIFGRRNDGWRVLVRSEVPMGPIGDPLEKLVVTSTPRKVMIFGYRVDERLDEEAFRLLQILEANRGQWFSINHLEKTIWPIPDDAPDNPHQALSRYKKAINDFLRTHLDSQNAIEMQPFQGYRMKVRVWPNVVPS